MERHAGWKIVLIDDEDDIRELMTIALKDAGYAVQTAPDGATGLRLCETNPPLIVITDIRMPGLDGIHRLSDIADRLLCYWGVGTYQHRGLVI